VTARILLVEDEPAIAEVIAFALRIGGFPVECSALVREVIFASAHFDLGLGGLLSCVFGMLYSAPTAAAAS
jgi:DNA-binding response OmpR family regulator